MKQPDDRGRLEDMLESAEEAAEIARGKSRADLDRDRLLNLGLARLLEIIGEAAARVSPAFRESCPAIPWADIIGLRNRLIHNYRDVDLDILWRIVEADVPALIDALKRVLAERGNQ